MKAEFEVPSTEEQSERAVLVGIDRRDPDWPVEESLAELGRLADTAGAEVVATTYQRLDAPNPRTFVGSGKVEEIAELARANDAHLVIFDDELTPSQQNNLEKAMKDCKIVDRTALILDIFALHATTREGRLQVRLAQNQYLYPRLRGMWAHLASNRMGGGVGSRFGEGESQLEVDRRMVRKRIDKIRAELSKLERDRDLQRSRRVEGGISKVSLVGYTNAGKSTTLNALTGAGVLVEDKLFATLDSTTRRFVLPEGRKITLTDTVGFIQKLPTTLVEAFKSTLDEVVGADLILHVCDASSPKMDAQYRAVQEILEQIGALAIPSIVVFNKVDLISPDALASLESRYRGSVCISAATGYGISNLVDRISQACGAADVSMTVLIPYDKGNLVRLAHEKCTLASVGYLEDGTQMVIKCPTSIAKTFEPYAIDVSEPDDVETPDVGRLDDGDGWEDFPQDEDGSVSEPDGSFSGGGRPRREVHTLGMKLLSENADALEPVEGLSNVFAAFAAEDAVVEPGCRRMVGSGVAVALPSGMAGLAIPSRAFSEATGLRFANSPGLIDTGYRGELKFICQNPTDSPIRIDAGREIACIAVMPTLRLDLVQGARTGDVEDAVAAEDAEYEADAASGRDSAEARGRGDREIAEDATQMEGGSVDMDAGSTSVNLNGSGNGTVEAVFEMVVDGMEPPMYAHGTDNGLDLRSAETVDLAPSQRRTIGFGFSLELPDGCIAFVQPRSGISLREGLSIVDSPSIVDPEEASIELSACFVNLDPENTIHIEKGERIAQLVVMEAPQVEMVLLDELDSTDRGESGFGSSGA